MAVFGADKTTRLAAKANVATTPAPVPDPLVIVTNNVYVTHAYDGIKDETTGRDKNLRLKFHAGQVVRQSEIDALNY
jgi:hypothetical protein